MATIQAGACANCLHPMSVHKGRGISGRPICWAPYCACEHQTTDYYAADSAPAPAIVDLETINWRELEIDLAMAHYGLCTKAWHIINALRAQVNECHITEGAEPPYPDAPTGD